MFALFQFNNKGTVETVRAHYESKQKEVIFHLTVNGALQLSTTGDRGA